MSSNGFEAVLEPVAAHRRGLLVFSACATLIGIALIGDMPLRPSLKALFALLWMWRGLLELASLFRGMSRTRRLRIRSTGAAEALSNGGRVRPLELLAGSVILSRVAWLRLRFDDGLQYGELVFTSGRRNDDWRRLMLIWRQRAFGGPRGS
ncbi:MAG TPA: hypothetical protein VKZ91_14800 [Woeseiaceae bacterium]|nr:hypothetical protein [Woeseiaceae bacterium]